MDWIVVSKGDIRARGIADRHYSRQKKGTPLFTRPGNNLVFLTKDCSALWVSWKPANGIKRMDTAGDVYECTIFHRDGGVLASELVREAIELTEQLWGKSPDGWITYIADDKVKSVNPGYCFKQAGFQVAGRNKKGNLTKLVAPNKGGGEK
uniref:Uncharacterized protein n=2 Tax=viral metagenome TaxID=1070528 RepID=A0A6M3LF66_9ZZZZ